MNATVTGPDGKVRCGWSAAAPELAAYHDSEWGFPVADDRRLFEKMCLETLQSGLSWRTIYRKRDSLREAFADFEIDRVAAFGARDVHRLLEDKGIVRHRGKIEAIINNARRARELIDNEGSLAAFVWRYEPNAVAGPPKRRSTSPESTLLSKELKRRGWKFVGPTTLYAFMQATGLVNDHATACVVRPQVMCARSRFAPTGS